MKKIFTKIKLPHILLFAYIIALVIEVFFCVPYNRFETFLSEQNVPHTVIIDSGYSPISDINYNRASWRNGSIKISRVNIPQLVINIVVTSIVTAIFYFVLTRKCSLGEKAREQVLQESINKLTEENDVIKEQSSALRSQNIQSQQTIEELSSEVDELRQFKIRSEDVPTYPDIDIASLAFADAKTQEKAKRRYADDMYLYLKYILEHRLLDADRQASDEANTDNKDKTAKCEWVKNVLSGDSLRSVDVSNFLSDELVDNIINAQASLWDGSGIIESGADEKKPYEANYKSQSSQSGEYVPVHILSPRNGYYKDSIERSEKNSTLIDKWMDKTTHCLYMFTIYRDGKPESFFVTREFFDTLYEYFDV